MNAPADVFLCARRKPLSSYRPYWAKRFGTAPFSTHEPSRDGTPGLGQLRHCSGQWRRLCDHPSFGASVIGRMLESGLSGWCIIAQPDWTSAEAFKALGKPNLFWGVTATTWTQ